MHRHGGETQPAPSAKSGVTGGWWGKRTVEGGRQLELWPASLGSEAVELNTGISHREKASQVPGREPARTSTTLWGPSLDPSREVVRSKPGQESS